MELPVSGQHIAGAADTCLDDGLVAFPSGAEPKV